MVILRGANRGTVILRGANRGTVILRERSESQNPQHDVMPRKATWTLRLHSGQALRLAQGVRGRDAEEGKLTQPFGFAQGPTQRCRDAEEIFEV
jgi:hypothetical protein